MTYSVDAAGRGSATVQPGPGRSNVSFRGHAGPDGYLVVPSDAEAALAAGELDERLFDVKYLVDNGYGDTGGASAGQVPLIVRYQQRMAAATVHQKAAALPASTTPLTLGGINGAAVRVDKKHAGSFWAAVRGTGAAPAPSGLAHPKAAAPARLGDGLSKVWLDARVTSLDDVSGPQIGAPTAWAAGYDGTGVDVGVIDTGIDATHPDLAGKVVASQNFVPAGSPGGGDPTDVTDRFGHGTHVASIIAGSGAASGGRYRGVAPGAGLIIAKALDDTGTGSDSTIISAMQWEAATAHAKIVNMSLGSDGASDGTDPLSQAVNDLSAQFGTLFVVAAGNSGPDTKTVGAPGAATAALTVGAVDSHDQTTSFSSRGPRLGDGGLKPEIAAPGLNIVAARAAGTSLGEGSLPGDGPIDQFYTAASGTSMATPHVAAAAAELAEQHPDWTGAQLRAALVGTSHALGDDVYDYGAGRLDIGRAITQKVFDDTPSVSGDFLLPVTGDPVTRTVTYTNTGTTDVTLDLATDLVSGGAAVTGLVSVSPGTLTVPAGGTASTVLTLDVSGRKSGVYTGRLQATDAAGDHLTVPIGIRVHPPLRTLRVLVDTRGEPLHFVTPVNFQPGNVTAARVNDDNPALADEPLSTAVDFTHWTATDQQGVFEMDLQLAQGGVYSLNSGFDLEDLTDGSWGHWWLTKPQVTLDQDTTVTFVLRDAAPVTIRTDRPSEASVGEVGDLRTTATGAAVSDFGVYFPLGATGSRFFMTPTDTPTVGSYAAWFNQIRPASQAVATLSGGGPPTDLDAHYASEYNIVPKFTSDQHLRMSTEAELRAGGHVRGTLVVTDPDPEGPNGGGIDQMLSTMDRAIAAGAAGVLTDSTWARLLFDPSYADHMKIPLLWVNASTGDDVRLRMAHSSHLSVDIHSQVDTPYEYQLSYPMLDRIPDALTFQATSDTMVRIAATYHSQDQVRTQFGPFATDQEAQSTFVPRQTFNIEPGHRFVTGVKRFDYYNVSGPRETRVRLYEFNDIAHAGSPGSARLASSERAFTTAGDEKEDWNGALLPTQSTAGPALPTGPDNLLTVFPCDACRQGDTLRVRGFTALGAEYSDASDASHVYNGEPGTEEGHLYQGGTEVQPQTDAAGLPYYTLPQGAATYRYTDTYTDGYTGGHAASSVATTWTFRSSRPTADGVDLPYVCADSVLFGDTDPCAWQPLIYPHYRFGLAADDTTPAGRPFTFTVSAQDAAPERAAALAGLSAWISSDGGAHWIRARVRRAGHSFAVTVFNPRVPAGSTGNVSVRVRAWDAAGNSVEQTVTDAYRLR